MKKIEENDEKTIQNNNTIRYKKGGRAIINRIWTFASSKINEYLTADYTNEKEGDLKILHRANNLFAGEDSQKESVTGKSETHRWTSGFPTISAD